MLRIGMLTSGGDCQALNAAMRGVVKGICNKRKDVEIQTDACAGQGWNRQGGGNETHIS